MKNTFFILTMLLILMSCGKDDDSNPKDACKLTITYTASLGHVDVEPLMERYPKGTLVKVKAIPNNGVAFKDWKMNSSTINQKEMVFSIDDDTEITANFIESEQKNFSLTTHCQSTHGSITVSPMMNSYPMGTTIQISAVAKENYKFSHWEGILSTYATIQIDMTSNFDLTAIFVNMDGTEANTSDLALFSMNIRWDKDETWRIESELTYEKTAKEISGATIKVNNNVLTEDDFFKGSYEGTIELSTPQQTFTVSIQYNQLPLQSFEIDVPPVFSTNSALSGNMKDGVVTLNWEQLNCSGYVLHKRIENSTGNKVEMTMNEGSLLNTHSYSTTVSDILSGNVTLSPSPQYFTLWVSPANTLQNLQGFHSQSYIRMIGKKTNGVSNKPSLQ
jgi:hypothetical protein